jgi:hypothetical protein
MEEREKKKEQMKVESLRRAQERKTKPILPSPRSDTDEVDPLAKKAKTAADMVNTMHGGRDPALPMP